MKGLHRIITTGFNLLRTMRVFTLKTVFRKPIAAITILCFFLVCCTVWNNTNLFQRIYGNEQTKVGILIPLDNITFTMDHIFNLDLSTAKIDFVYKVYMKSNDVVKRLLNRDLNGNYEITSSGESTKKFTKTVNKLAHKAIKVGMDYIILICNGTLPNNLQRNWTRYSVEKLREHIVPHFGIVVATEMGEGHSTRPCFIVIHKSHMEIFQQFFPSSHDFDSSKAIHWITDIYKPYHITTLNVKKYIEPSQVSVQFKAGNRLEDKYLEKDRNKITDHIISMHSVFIVSYSLFGSDARYTDGVLTNTELIKTIYPGWKLWLYHDNSVPLNVISTICEKVIVKCVNMTGSMLTNKMSWRFLVASVPFVSRYIIRDTDSRLSVREKAAVDEWIASGKKFHVMRDHPSHSSYAMSGGMWGGTREAIPDMESSLHRRVMNDNYLEDMIFLEKAVWPIAQSSVYQHDSFSCDRFGGGHPFPTKRVGLEHVGSVYINGEMRKEDTDILKNAKPSTQCNTYSERKKAD